MVELSSGPYMGRPRKPKLQTQTEKSHRYEPFTKRVAKLKIDPVHQVQKSRLKESLNDLSQSHFRTALDEWSELNLTTTFTSLWKKVNTLSESLPQLLHHADAIVDILLEHISKEDPLALEALLSLVAHLAHDLGQEFEKYFTRTVALVAKVSTTQDDPAVIEACFTCLAWMYKYLSKSLVQDLQPLLGITLPYFTSRKEYVRRFTAESLAFLLRKAATLYQRNEKPLRTAIRCILQAATSKSSADAPALEACMILLAESAVGVDGGLHSSAPSLFECLLDEAVRVPATSEVALRILEGVTVNLIHCTNAIGFESWLNAILGQAITESLNLRTTFCARLILIACTTRDGSRVRDWNTILSFTEQLLTKIQQAEDTPHPLYTKTGLSKIVATTIQNAPLNQVLPSIPSLVRKLIAISRPQQFFTFCELVAQLGRTRFQDLLFPHLQQYIMSNWSSDETGLAMLLDNLSGHDYTQKNANHGNSITIPHEWEISRVSKWKKPKTDTSDNDADLVDHLLARAVHYPRNPAVAEKWQRNLQEAFDEALRDTYKPAAFTTRLSLGWGAMALTTFSKDGPALDLSSWSRIAALPFDRFQVLPFVDMCVIKARAQEAVPLDQTTINSITLKLLPNMLNRSLGLRRSSLELLRSIHRDGDNGWVTSLVDLLLEITNTSYSISNARQIAMLIRRLPSGQKTVPEDHALSRLVPSFCLGLLPDYHDQLRKDVCTVLGESLTTVQLEESVIEVVSNWLQSAPTTELAIRKDEIEPSKRPSLFECTRLSNLDQIALEITGRFCNSTQEITKRARIAHAPLVQDLPKNSRAIALQVLQAMPQIAEKRSRIVIPSFLAAQRERSGHDLSLLDESNSIHTIGPEIETSGWTLKDRKSFLLLLGLFNNPRTLYRTEEVYAVLLELLSNGDSETRKLSLLALLKWKNQTWLTYQDQLLKVAEDKATTSELGSMLYTDQDATLIKSDDRDIVLPVLLRLIFGQLISRVGVRGSQEAKRKSLLRLIFRMHEADINLFLDVLLGRLRDIDLAEITQRRNQILSQDVISLDQQFGFLRMVQSMLEILQTQFQPFGGKIISAVLYCTIRASRQINSLDDTDSTPALLRSTRRAGIQCLNAIFEYCPQLDLKDYLRLIFADLIGPRLGKFVSENAQGISSLLKTLAAWAKNERSFSYLLFGSNQVLPKLWELLTFEAAKPDVKIFVLENIVSSGLDVADTKSQDGAAACEVFTAQIVPLLNSISKVLEHNPSKPLLLTTARVVERLAGLTGPSEMKWKIVQLLVTIIEEPVQRLAPHIKAQILKTLLTIASDLDASQIQSLRSSFLSSLASYLDFFKDLPNRQTCVQLLKILASGNLELIKAINICEGLNAQSDRSLDEFDHERQAETFFQIHDLLNSNPEQYSLLPILHNLIYCIRSSAETEVRGSALSCAKHLIKSVTSSFETWQDVQQILLSAVRKHIRDDSELVRADFVELLGTVVKEWEHLAVSKELQPLLMGSDDEASFFLNVLHIQQHRRTRAIRRLTSEIEQGTITSQTISLYLLPLLQKFSDDEGKDISAQTAKGQSLASMSIVLQWLDWKTFRMSFRHYKQTLDQKTGDDKIDIRLLSHAAQALTDAVQGQNIQMTTTPMPHLTASLPDQDVLSNELKSHFIPKLAELSRYKDEGEISQRIPAAVVAVKLIKLLPQQEHSLLASPVVLDVAQILRSRTQEVRDLARNKLAEIVSILGPTSMQFVLKELRTALTRGYQLHVLSYTLHTILLVTADTRTIGDLDYCLEDMVKVILDDIFGVVGEEKNNKDYSSDMREVKGNKSFDSLEILAKCTGLHHLSKLVLPFESLLTGSLTPKHIRHVDELFRRIGIGISHGSHAGSQDLLVLAFQLIKAFYRSKPAQPPKPLTNDDKNRERYLIQMDSSEKVRKSWSTSLMYKIAKFAIDVARSTFARYSELLTPENVHGFLPIIGDALLEAQEDVKISALRLLTTVLKLKMPELDENTTLYVMEAVKIVKSAISTNDEIAQAALKLVSAIVRDKPNVQIRDSDIAYLLKRTLPDLQEPDRQGVTFNFVKAVMARKLQIPEIYELVDQLGHMMIVSQSRNSREAARGVYVHFLLDYPQGKTRWSKQIKFLVKNLEYEHPEGRESVMEAISGLLSKVEKGVFNDLAAALFIPIVLRMTKDDNMRCRELAGALLAQLFKKTPSETLSTMLEPLQAWLVQDENAVLRKLSLQTWSILLKTRSKEVKSSVGILMESISEILRPDELPSAEWETRYHALEVLNVLVQEFPDQLLVQKQQDLWIDIISTLASPHSWLQEAAGKLLESLFNNNDQVEEISIPAVSLHGLKFDEEEALLILKNSVKIIKSQGASKELSRITLKNLLLIGRAFANSNSQLAINHHEATDGQSQEDEEADMEVSTTNGNNSISAVQYLIDQGAYILRREPPKYTSTSLQPKINFAVLLATYISSLSASSLARLDSSIASLLVPLLYITSPSTPVPRSVDPVFAETYTQLIESAQAVLDATQGKVGNQKYMTYVTAATKMAREKRQERRSKRAIDTVAQPERAAREKRKKFEKKKGRRKEIKGIHRSLRRKDLGF